MKTIIVGPNDANQRIDKFLQKYFKTMSLGMIYKSIRKKRVKINGKRVEKNYRLIENDVIDLYINDSFFEETKAFKTKIAPEAFKGVNPNIHIIYEDENILLTDKQPGMVVHPTGQEQTNTLITHIQSYLYHKKEFDPESEHTFAPALCNRIDRNTGGIVIAAKNAEALRIVNEKIKHKEIRKFYLCLVHGLLEHKHGKLEGYLIKDHSTNKVSIYNAHQGKAKSIVTKYNVLKEKNNMSLVEVELITGRTHQIRAHFSSIGHPLAGDRKYGGKNLPGVHYQALYAYKLTFDFKTDAGILNGLKGKSFEVKEVDFASTGQAYDML
ncbi:MAG: RluA family pseudouridine synthase [Firmicutes bacterium]|nr:RluA family pseudouridine synthase [Bacillota bacterium]